jgi:SAM-dependent methyltransferase
MEPNQRPLWQLPQGVSRGAWDYVTREAIATEYDAYHANHPLLRVDESLLADWLGPASQSPSADAPRPWVADLGCGTGRLMPAIHRLGYPYLAIDLSQPMLREVRQRQPPDLAPSATDHVAANHVAADDIAAIRCNLVELDAIADGCCAAALCMFSTLGMIRGRAHRQRVLQHARRMVRPGGACIVHVHNRWNALRDPGGPAWLWHSWRQSRRDRQSDFGDRVYPYRGVPNMFLHIYSRRELQRDMQAAGWRCDRWLWLDQQSSGPLRHRWWIPRVRAGGWVVRGV